ncbi:MAG: class B sortase [Lachnospiraceae bacterium]|nr:class B sortase [Lachnospiraceae bacterium]
MRDETGRPRGKDGYGGSRNVNGYGDYDENRSSRGYGGSRNVNGYGDYDDGRSRNVNGGDYDDSRRNPDYRNSRPEESRETNGSGRKKRKHTFGDFIRLLLMLIALAVFCYSAYMLYTFYREYKKGSDEYDNLELNYTLEDTDESENMDALEDDQAVQSVSGERKMVTVTVDGEDVLLPVMNNPIDFKELQAINTDICGWLRIRAIDISYPLVQGEDNDFYLHRTFEKEDNFAGCLFLNCDNESDFSDTNTIIYGHNMKNGSMFGKLKQFREEEVFDKSKYFWIFTPDFIYQYRIFSAMVVNKTGLTYQVDFTEQEYQEFLDTAFEKSEVDNKNVEVTKDDKVVTLSTCTGDDATRFVVIGKLAQTYVSKQSALNEK